MGWESGWTPSDEDQGRGLEESELIGWLVDDPAAIPDLVVAQGWLGRSPQQDRWRVYLNPHLTEFIEVDAAGIVRAVPETGGLMTVWIRDGAEIEHRVRSGAVEGEYLDGSIVREAFYDAYADFGVTAFEELLAKKTTKCPACYRVTR